MTGRTGAVVVHHRSYDTIGTVVSDLLSQGLETADILIVDNSEETSSGRRLREILPQDVPLLFVANRGYGAAVNEGVRAIQTRASYEFLLVATHEVHLGAGSLVDLEAALDANPAIGAVGPTLLTTTNDGRDEVWSTGGKLTRWARIPRHHDHRAEPDVVFSRHEPAVVRRVWLDGAFVLYRARLLADFRINESFFMYVEEVELHLRLERAGHAIGWVPAARVHQSSAGTPMFYLGRNLVLLLRLNGQRLRIGLVPFVALRTALPQSVRRRSMRPVLDVVRGISRGLRERLVR
ncbi:glycosyltransferase [Curtobacterium sp. MCPF17_047]|uniref:glycosyltransferase n=1 Tax=Curtobacterium sp. MCPF17_047 TaxID=2175654 RepID=UPI0015E8E19A|nr:glycosyltransferase [Curtobacterium sp. MCPF17_047]